MKFKLFLAFFVMSFVHYSFSADSVEVYYFNNVGGPGFSIEAPSHASLEDIKGMIFKKLYPFADRSLYEDVKLIHGQSEIVDKNGLIESLEEGPPYVFIRKKPTELSKKISSMQDQANQMIKESKHSDHDKSNLSNAIHSIRWSYSDIIKNRSLIEALDLLKKIDTLDADVLLAELKKINKR